MPTSSENIPTWCVCRTISKEYAFGHVHITFWFHNGSVDPVHPCPETRGPLCRCHCQWFALSKHETLSNLLTTVEKCQAFYNSRDHAGVLGSTGWYLYSKNSKESFSSFGCFVDGHKTQKMRLHGGSSGSATAADLFGRRNKRVGWIVREDHHHQLWRWSLTPL